MAFNIAWRWHELICLLYGKMALLRLTSVVYSISLKLKYVPMIYALKYFEWMPFTHKHMDCNHKICVSPYIKIWYNIQQWRPCWIELHSYLLNYGVTMRLMKKCVKFTKKKYINQCITSALTDGLQSTFSHQLVWWGIEMVHSTKCKILIRL